MEFIIFILSVYYITHILLFDPDKVGPLSDSKQMIKVMTTDSNNAPHFTSRPVNIFDWFRRLFAAYYVEKNGDGDTIWRPRHIAVWVCPVCLSFWISLVLAGIYLYGTQDLFTAGFYVLGGAGFVTVVERLS